jgi:hypothetical protein
LYEHLDNEYDAWLSSFAARSLNSIDNKRKTPVQLKELSKSFRKSELALKIQSDRACVAKFDTIPSLSYQSKIHTCSYIRSGSFKETTNVS